MMELYSITVARTGNILVKANTKNEAFNKVRYMTTDEIEQKGNLTSWEPSDIECLTDNK